jgi:hypothetical protein
MQAWSECVPDVERDARAQPGSNTSIPPADIRSQLTTLLAGMILCLQQEAT